MSPWREKFGGRFAAVEFLVLRRVVMPFLGCYAFCFFALVARAMGKIVTPFLKILRLLHPTVQLLSVLDSMLWLDVCYLVALRSCLIDFSRLTYPVWNPL